MPSLWQPWLQDIGLRHQGVILAGVGRGCDVAVRHDPSKIAQRLLRAAVLVPHSGRFDHDPKRYIYIEDDYDRWRAAIVPFLDSWDHYPNHYVIHFIHAAQVIGYCGPEASPVFSTRWLEFYQEACATLHLNPESHVQMDKRLSAPTEEFEQQQHRVRRNAT